MIKEFLERRRKKKLLRTFRENMLEDGVPTNHLTDDELSECICKWAMAVNEALKPALLSMSQVAKALAVLANSHLNSITK